MTGRVAAVDLGATSGRVMLGEVGPNELALHPVARFPNAPVRTIDGLHWNILELYRNVVEGLHAAASEAPDLVSAGIDSWAVDYALLREGRMLGTPYHYRDERTGPAVESTHALVPPAELYAANGLQHLSFNTLFQLAADDADLLETADAMLLIPDLFGYWLTGRQVAERTNASTTGLLAVESRGWDDALIRRLGLPRDIFPELVDPGTTIGNLLPAVGSEIGAPRLKLLAVGSHDTASAVVAVPAITENFAYISCGTWGLVGVELEHPVLSEAARVADFTNEGGVDGRIRFLHNVMGLWLLSESVRSWERDGGTVDLPALLAEAAALREPVPVFDADDARFMTPGHMPARIADACRELGLRAPSTRAEFVRSIIESLADAFTRAVRTASDLSGRRVEIIHIVGGGSQNELLCQLVADRSGLPVLAGPVEATAIGNVLVQAREANIVSGDLESLRALVSRSTMPRQFEPTLRSENRSRR